MSDNFIREVKRRVDIMDVARRYGINVTNNNKALCCFHKEKSPSLSFHKEKQIWKCFGCGKGGDSISLVSELLNINALEAAKSINYTLGLGLDAENPTSYFEINQYKEKRKNEEMFRQWENKTFQLLCEYLYLLWKWQEIKDLENDLYIEALMNVDKVNYYIDTFFINGNDADKIWFWKHEKKVVKIIESRVRTFRAA